MSPPHLLQCFEERGSWTPVSVILSLPQPKVETNGVEGVEVEHCGAGFVGQAESASYGKGRGGRTPELGREGLNPFQTGSHLQGWNSGLIRAKGQTILSGHIIVILCPYRRATVAASEVSCSSRREMGVLSRLGARDCMGSRALCPCTHGQPGVSLISLHPSWGFRANPVQHSTPHPPKQIVVLRFPASYLPLIPPP